MKNTVTVRGVKIGEGMPKIIVPIALETGEEILEAAESVRDAKPDIVEWRADWFDGVFDFAQVEEILQGLRTALGEIPILFTFRSLREGGEKAIAPDAYARLIGDATATGLVDLVDVEIFVGDELAREIIEDAHSKGVKVVASNHDFDRTPDKDELVRRLVKMQEMGADIPKIAVMPTDRKDVLTLLAATEEMAGRIAEGPIITMSMAGTGLISRLCGEVFGSACTFGAVGNASAPGQMEATGLRTVLELIHGSLQGIGEQTHKGGSSMENQAKNRPEHNVFLIGFMGAGKSTVSRALWKRLGMDRVEMDQRIAEKQGMTIPEIFDKYGETYFRDLESRCLVELQHGSPCIVSCGGGVVIRDENIGHMKTNGCVVLLAAEPATILERVKDSDERPILNGHMNVDYLSELLDRRRERYYAAADIVVATDGKSIVEVCDEVIAKLNAYDSASL